MSASQITLSAFRARAMRSRAGRGKTPVIVAIVCTDLGTHTSKRPVCRASSVASATCSGVRILAAGAGVVLVDETPDGHDPGVVDEDVDRPEPALDLVGEALDRLAPRDVELDGDRAAAELIGGLLRGGDVEVADGHAHALAEERGRHRPADAPCAAGDRDDLSGEDSRLLGHRDG